MLQAVMHLYPRPLATPKFYRSHGEKSGEGLGSLLRYGLEMVDSVSTEHALAQHFQFVT